MNTREIIAELRRSAVEDREPYSCDPFAFIAAIAMSDDCMLNKNGPTAHAMFYLLVAHALEDECSTS